MNNPSDTACNSPETAARHEQLMKLLADFWTLRIVEVLAQGEQRFGQIEKGLCSCNPVTLSGRLKKLEEAGMLTRHTETKDKQSVTYQLTTKGHDVLPVVTALKQFAQRHAGEPAAAVPTVG